MKKIFIAFLIFTFSFKLPIGDVVEISGNLVQSTGKYVHILPAFLGWLIVYFGVKEIQDQENVYEETLFKLIIASVIVNIFFFLNNILTFVTQGALLSILSILGFILEFLIFHNILEGYIKIEKKSRVDLSAVKTKKLLLWQLALSVGLQFVILLPVLAIILMLALLVIRVMMIVGFYKAAKTYKTI